MKEQHWAVSARYAAAGPRPGNRRHPAPEDFCRRTVVGLAAASTVEVVLDLLDVPEDVRRAIRVQDVVRSFVEGTLVPDQPHPHHAMGLTFLLDEDISPQRLAQEIARACGGVLKPGDAIRVDHAKIACVVTDETLSLPSFGWQWQRSLKEPRRVKLQRNTCK